MNEVIDGWTVLGRTIFNITSKDPHPSQLSNHFETIQLLVKEGSLYKGKMYDVHLFHSAIRQGLEVRRNRLLKAMFGSHPTILEANIALELAEYAGMTTKTWYP